MMRDAGQDEARKAGHARCFGKLVGGVNPWQHGAAPLRINLGMWRSLQRLGFGGLVNCHRNPRNHVDIVTVARQILAQAPQASP